MLLVIMSSPDRALELVISYSHKDEALKQELLKHLSPLRRQGVVQAWHDRDIDAGTEWKSAINSRFNTADIILLLVSPDFVDSEFCYEIEMKRAIERHDAGQCCVVPIFLRPCDWKGMPFGKIEGLPDDAIPVVSNQWGSRDDGFLRVAQGIRRVAEKLLVASPPGAHRTAVANRALFRPASQSGSTESIDDSGPGVLLNSNYFEADSVVEKEHDHYELRIAPASAEEEADLRALRGDNRYHGIQAEFAHGNEAFLARVQSSRSESSGGRRVWVVELQRQNTNQYAYDVIQSGTATPEQILTSRVRRMLLAQKSPKARGVPDADFFTTTEREQKFDPIFPDIWKQSSRDVVKFLRFARLAATLRLKTTRTCDDILELRLGPVRDEQLHVKFRGRRKEQWSNETISIDVEGDCPLQLTK